MQPLIDATSDMAGGASRQIAQVKSAKAESAAATSATGTFAAGFKFMLSISSSSSSSSSTMGDAFGTGGSAVLPLGTAVADLVDAAEEEVVVVAAPLPPRVAKRVERRWGASSSAMRVVATIAARRVDRRAVVVGEIEDVPIEKEGVTMLKN